MMKSYKFQIYILFLMLLAPAALLAQAVSGPCTGTYAIVEERSTFYFQLGREQLVQITRYTDLTNADIAYHTDFQGSGTSVLRVTQRPYIATPLNAIVESRSVDTTGQLHSDIRLEIVLSDMDNFIMKVPQTTGEVIVYRYSFAKKELVCEIQSAPIVPSVSPPTQLLVVPDGSVFQAAENYGQLLGVIDSLTSEVDTLSERADACEADLGVVRARNGDLDRALALSIDLTERQGQVIDNYKSRLSTAEALADKYKEINGILMRTLTRDVVSVANDSAGSASGERLRKLVKSAIRRVKKAAKSAN